jgi:hypothetical protein
LWTVHYYHLQFPVNFFKFDRERTKMPELLVLAAVKVGEIFQKCIFCNGMLLEQSILSNKLFATALMGTDQHLEKRETRGEIKEARDKKQD